MECDDISQLNREASLQYQPIEPDLHEQPTIRQHDNLLETANGCPFVIQETAYPAGMLLNDDLPSKYMTSLPDLEDVFLGRVGGEGRSDLSFDEGDIDLQPEACEGLPSTQSPYPNSERSASEHKAEILWQFLFDDDGPWSFDVC